MAVNLFDPNFYRSVNPDLAALTDQQALQHLQVFGLNEKRRFSPYIDIDIYRGLNPDLTAAGLTANRQLFDHLQAFGISEGRSFSSVFDASLYRSFNSDLLAAGLNNEQLLEHFQTFGINEGRAASGIFDISFYLDNNPDLRQAGFNNQQALQHFKLFGINEGRAASGIFDVSFYLQKNPDLRQAGFNNQQALQHFQVFGINEGRAASGIFNVSFYLDNNPDLRQAGFNNQQALQHYILFGDREGRLAAPIIFSAEPGSDINTALDVGILGGDRSLSDSVSGADTNDFYRFTLSEPSQTSLTLEGAANLNLIRDINGNNLVDDSGTEVRIAGFVFPSPDEIIGSATAIANNENQEPGEIRGILPAGTYFVQVENREESGELQNYNLSLAATPANLPQDNAGNTLAGARDIGVLQETRAFSDFVGLSDRNDIYSFTLNAPATVNLSIDGLNARANLSLVEDGGDGAIDVTDIAGQRDDIIDFFAPENTEGGTINQSLPTGTYFVRVASDEDTNYNLSLSTNPFTPPQDNAGNSIAEARDLGAIGDSQTLSDAIGFIDPTDFYRFTLENTSQITLGLSGLSSQPEFFASFTSLDIIQDTNGNGEVDFDPSPSEVINGISGLGNSITQSLLAGTYFLRIFHGGRETSLDYDLTVAAVPFAAPPDGAGNSLSEAREVDILTGSPTFEDFVGGVDREDFYRFNLESDSQVSLVLDGVSEFTSLILIRDFNGNGIAEFEETIAADGASLSSPARIERNLLAGTYFVEVEASGGDTNYNLTMSV